jgi:hypothetical protein
MSTSPLLQVSQFNTPWNGAVRLGSPVSVANLVGGTLSILPENVDRRMVKVSRFPSWITAGSNWDQDVIYLLDGELRFIDCNPVWDTFAAANGGQGIARAAMPGKLILDYVPDVLRTFYVHKFWFAKRTPSWTEFDYDCSSPEKIRLFRMSMMPVEDDMLVVNHLRLEEDCAVGPPLTEERKQAYVSSGVIITMCANCRKTQRIDDSMTWDWIPEFLRDTGGCPVSHGLCPRCASHLY